MKNYDLVAFYSSRANAEQVRQDLLNAGFDRDDVKVYAPNNSEAGGGFWDSIKEAFGFIDDDDRALYNEATRRGAVAVAVSLEDADAPPAQSVRLIFEKYRPMDLEHEATQWRAQGWTAGRRTQTTAAARTTQSRTAATTTSTKRAAAGNQERIPVVQEELQVGKRQVQGGGVRVHSRVVEKPVQEELRLREERVNVERRPANRPVTDADQAFKERAIEATETREEAIVNKQARVVEEVVVNKQANERTQTVRDTVRKTEVDVEKMPGNRTTTSESTYDDFAVQLASDQRYRGRDWDSLEPDIRRNFEQRYPGNRWEQAKDTIRRGYDRARARA